LGFENAGIPGVFTTLRWLQLLRRLVVFVLFVSGGKLFVAGSMTLEKKPLPTGVKVHVYLLIDSVINSIENDIIVTEINNGLATIIIVTIIIT